MRASNLELATSHFYTDSYRCRLRELSVQKWVVASTKFFESRVWRPASLTPRPAI